MLTFQHASFLLDALADGGVHQPRSVTLEGECPFDMCATKLSLRANRTFAMMAVTSFRVGIWSMFARDAEMPFAIADLPLGVGGGVEIRCGWRVEMTIRLPYPSILGIRPYVFAMLAGVST